MSTVLVNGIEKLINVAKIYKKNDIKLYFIILDNE